MNANVLPVIQLILTPTLRLCAVYVSHRAMYFKAYIDPCTRDHIDIVLSGHFIVWYSIELFRK